MLASEETSILVHKKSLFIFQKLRYLAFCNNINMSGYLKFVIYKQNNLLISCRKTLLICSQEQVKSAGNTYKRRNLIQNLSF